MGTFTGYRCSTCGEAFEPEQGIYVCPNDGGNLDVLINPKEISQHWTPHLIEQASEGSIWRYLPLLPVREPGHLGTPLHAVGMTPLYRTKRLGGEIGLQQLWIKDDGRNPTASFKDRASALVVVRAEEIDATTIVTASTGNAGAALAGMAAAAGMPAVILAPKSAPQAKVAQLLMFGARVYLVDGTYDDAFDLTLMAAETFGWYCRNTGYNPFTAEGKKTASFEICEQLTLELRGTKTKPENQSWDVPDALFVSVGDGNIISGLHKGFKDLLELNWIERIPRLFGVQAEGSAAVANAYFAGTETIEPVRAETFADSISVDLPRDGLRALRAATGSGGAYVSVSDAAIRSAMTAMARQEAIFAEPAGATAFAGLLAAKEHGLLSSDERIVVLNTGNGLKDVKAAMQAVGEPVVIEPTLDALKEATLAAPTGGNQNER